MPRKKRNELTAGLFVVAAIVLLLGVILWLGASGLLKTRGQLVSFYTPVSSGSLGLKEGDMVTIGDAKVGQIVSVEYKDDKCNYQARLERDDIHIKSDGQALVASPPVGSAKIVITAIGKSDTPADEEHPIMISGGLDKAIADISQAISVVKNELDASKSSTILYKMHTILAGLSDASTDIRAIAQAVRQETDVANPKSLLAKTHSGMDDITAITSDARTKVPDTLTAVKNTAEQIEQYTKTDLAAIMSQLRKTSDEVFEIVKDFHVVSTEVKGVVVVNRDRIDELIDNMTLVSANLKATSKEIRRSPWKLIRKPEPGEVESQNIADAARAFLGGAEQLDQALMRLEALAKSNPDGIPKDDPQLEKIRKQVEESFTRFSKAEQTLWKEIAK